MTSPSHITGRDHDDMISRMSQDIERKNDMGLTVQSVWIFGGTNSARIEYRKESDQ